MPRTVRIAPGASTTGTAGTAGTFRDFSVVLTTCAAHAQLGRSLKIIIGTVINSPDRAVDFDNVRLTVDSVPEPITFTLARLGLLGLGSVALRRKHRRA